MSDTLPGRKRAWLRLIAAPRVVSADATGLSSDTVVLAVAASDFALLLAVVTLNPEVAAVRATAIAVSVGFPLSIAAYLFEVYRRKAGHRVIRSVFDAAAEYCLYGALLATVVALYALLTHVDPTAGFVFGALSLITFGFSVLVLLVQIGLHFIGRERPRRKRNVMGRAAASDQPLDAAPTGEGANSDQGAAAATRAG